MDGKTKAANAGTFAASYNSLIKNQQIFDTNNYKSEAVSDTRKNGKVTKLFSEFQYCCSFCWRPLPDNSIRFNGIGACPVCWKLSHLLVDSLRRYRREYSKRFREVKR